MVCSISPASRMLTGVTSILSDGATAWMAANWLVPPPCGRVPKHCRPRDAGRDLLEQLLARTFAHISFERYAHDIICHCKSAEEARALWSAIADRFAACKLVLHPEKTKIIYCKDVNWRGDFPNIRFDFLGFQFRARKIMWVKADRRIFAHSFQPAASPKALTRISREIRSWALHHRSDKSLNELAQMYNSCIRGWISYYGHFYRTQLRSTLKRIDAYVIRWARRKFKRMRHQTKGARDWFDRLRRANPTLFVHWMLCHGGGRTSGVV
jgi:RNA-directed DNA polymerase